VPDVLRQIRVQKGMSQEDLALALGYDQSFMSRIERGIHRLDLVELNRFCEVIGISPAQLFNRFRAAVAAGQVQGPPLPQRVRRKVKQK
jgi:transcriptional regulator with XRE-family HTH domain